MLSHVIAYDRRERLAAIACSLIIGFLIAKAMVRGGIDFHVMYMSGQRALHGEPIYLLSDGWMPFKYHPVWAVLFSAFSPLPERLAFTLYDTGMLACWIWGASIWARWLGFDIKKPTNFLILTLLSFNALSSEMNFGQINGLLFLGATKLFEWMSARPQRWFAAGLLVALLCTLKLNFGLLALFCCLRNIRSLFGMAAGAVAAHVATAALFGHWFDVALYQDWLDVVLSQSAEQYIDPDVQGWLRFLLLTLPDLAPALWCVSVVLAVLGGIALDRYLGAGQAVTGAYWLASTYLLSPLAWWNQILFTLPLAFVLLRHDIGTAGRYVLYVSLSVYALASPTLLGRPGIEAFRTYHGFFFASGAIMLVMALCVLRSCRTAAVPLEPVPALAVARRKPFGST